MKHAHIWSTREEWIANAEHDVRTTCYDTERVSNAAADYLDPNDLVERLRSIRLASSRLISELGDGEAKISTVRTLGNELQRVVNFCVIASESWRLAARNAESKAVRIEQDRRTTDEAWHDELERRAQVDSHLTFLKSKPTS